MIASALRLMLVRPYKDFYASVKHYYDCLTRRRRSVDASDDACYVTVQNHAPQRGHYCNALGRVRTMQCNVQH